MNKLEIVSLSHLEEILRFYSIDTELYGKGERKDLEDLYDEIIDGESEIFSNGKDVLRVINTVNLFIFYKDESPNEYLFLREEKQVFNDSRVKIRNLLPSISEKKLREENSLTSLQRGVEEELGLMLNLQKLERLPDRIEIKKSKSYGIYTKNYMEEYFYLLEDVQYRKRYIEVQSKKKICFSWQKII